MKILLLSFYYPPDLSAGSFRAIALIKALRDVGPPSLEIDVITTQPNRYVDIAHTVDSVEDHGWLRIRRVDLPAHSSGMKDQARAFVSYAKAVLALTRKGDWDLVLATSSRLMTAALASHLAHRQHLPLYLDIRDLFTDTIDDVLARSSLRHFLPAFKMIERRTFRAASRINLVSEGFLNHVSRITDLEKCVVFTNGIDDVFLRTDFRKDTTSQAIGELPLVLYAGNIGEGQGLQNILPKAARKLCDDVVFRIVGDGGRATRLKENLALEGLSTDIIGMYPPVSRDKLLDEYRQADILFLHLNDYQAFRRVLPSKIFEYAATGKPIVAGVAGYSAEFLKNNIPCVQIFDPCDVDGMVTAVKRATHEPPSVDRSDFCDTFARSKIMQHMANDIVEHAILSKI